MGASNKESFHSQPHRSTIKEIHFHSPQFSTYTLALLLLLSGDKGSPSGVPVPENFNPSDVRSFPQWAIVLLIGPQQGDACSGT